MQTSAGAAGKQPLYDGMKVAGTIRGCLFTGAITHRYTNRSQTDIEASHAMVVPPLAALTGLKCSLRGEPAAADIVSESEALSITEQAIEAGNTGVAVKYVPGQRSVVSVKAGTLHPGDELEIELSLAFPLPQIGDRMRLAFPTALVKKSRIARRDAGSQFPLNLEYDYSADYPCEVEIEVHGPAAQARISSPENLAVSRSNGGCKLISCRRGMTSDFVCDFLGMQQVDYVAAGTAADGKVGLMVRTFPKPAARPDGFVSAKILADCSSSMAGPAMNFVRSFLYDFLDNMGGQDSCTLSKYGSSCRHVKAEPVQASANGRSQIESFILGLEADMGRTDTALALAQVAALRKHDAQDILLLTCGAAHDMARIAQAAGGHRCFIVGIGNADHSLLQAVAERTGGKYFSLQGRDDVGGLVAAILACMRAPRASGLEVAWPDKLAWQVDPPAVAEGQPLDCYACFDRKPARGSRATISYVQGGREVSKEIDLDQAVENSSIAKLAIARKMEDLLLEERDQEAHGLAEAERILAPNASFVFYADRAGFGMADSLPEQEDVPVPYPDGQRGLPGRIEIMRMQGPPSAPSAGRRMQETRHVMRPYVLPQPSENRSVRGWMTESPGKLSELLPPPGEHSQMSVRMPGQRPGYVGGKHWLYSKTQSGLLCTLIMMFFPVHEERIKRLSLCLHSMREGLSPVVLLHKDQVAGSGVRQGKYPLLLGKNWLLFRMPLNVVEADFYAAAKCLGVEVVDAPQKRI